MRELRAITEDEFEPLLAVLMTAFGEDSSPEETAVERGVFEFDRSIGAFEDGDLVGSAAAYTFGLTVPGGTVLPAAGVTWVGVLPTHRRRGLLREMMAFQLDDIADRGEPLAVLTASEGAIYGRFGYGLSTFFAAAELPCKGTGLLRPPAAEGRLRLVSGETAAKVFPEVWDKVRVSRPGSLSRSPAFWEAYFADLASWRDGASAHYYVVHEGADGPDAYMTYRRKSGEGDNTVLLGLMHAADPEVEAAFLRYLLDLDLARTLKLHWRPLDDHLRWRLADNDHYKVNRVGDWLWTRLMDIPAALSARAYASEGTLTFEVRDQARPANSGRYRLDGSPEGAAATRLPGAGDADLSLDVDALGAAYLGGVRFSTLARAGRVTGDPAAVRRADDLFRSDPLPFCDLPF